MIKIRNITLLAVLALISPALSAEISCYSPDYEYRHCVLPNADTLKVKLKMDHQGGCKKNDTWGIDAKGVWVDMGCQATFKYKEKTQQSWLSRLMPASWRKQSNENQ